MSQDHRPALPSRLSRIARGIILLALGLSAPAAWAEAPAAGGASPWEAGALVADPAAVLQAASLIDAGSGKGGATILFSETRLRFAEDGRETKVSRLLYRIENAQADASWSTIDAHWSPWHQERPQMRARVITPDGAVHSLDPATVTEAGAAPEPSLFEDDRILRAPLPAAGPGAVVEQEITIRDTAPFFAGGTVEQEFIRGMVPIHHVRMVVEAPAGLPLRHVVRALPEGGFREDVVDGERRLSFEYRDLSPYEEIESWQPPDVRWISYVAVSTGTSWADVARRYSEIVEAAVRGAEQAPEIRAFLRSASVPAASQRESIDRILARLGAEVRYTGVELGMGKIVPRPPAETLRRKFGDCKDKAVLLIALLRAVGIPAQVALLEAGVHTPELEESLPGMGAFNHAIVVVPGTPEIWIDPTDRYARAGELPAGDQGRLALIASPAADRLVRAPEAAAADNFLFSTREFFLADMGPARVVETREARGEIERDLRGWYATQDEKTLHEALAEGVQTRFLAAKLGKVDHSDPSDLAIPFRQRLEAEEARRGFTDMQTAVVAVFPAAALWGLPDELSEQEDKAEAKPKPRRTDYDLAVPFRQEIRYRAVPPAGFRPQPPPPGRVRQIGPGTLSEEYTAAADGTLAATVRFEIGKRRLTAEEFQALRDKVGELSKEDGVLLKFEQVGEAELAAGRVREAIEELRRLAALSPKKALPRTRLARALLAAGMGEAAREEARRAVALEPSFAPASSTLGWILQHDEVGRRFGKGFDRAGAIAAYRKAKELDPKEATIRADLAILLEYDAAGRRYAKGSDLAAAIDEYKALRADLQEATMDDNLLFAFLRAGRFAEMKELLGELDDSVTRSTLRLVAVAATEGADAASRQAERSFADGEKRRNALLQASQHLVQARRYPAAAALLEGASRQAANAAELLSRLELLRKLRPSEELTFPSDDPAGVVRRLFLLVLGSDSPDEKKIQALCSRDFGRELGGDKKADRRSGAGLEDFHRFLDARAELPANLLGDMMLAMLQPTVTGDEAAGFRVTLTTPFANGSMAAYVIREDGELKIAGLGTAAESLGSEALRRVERGDLQGARQWLDWAREEVKNAGGDDPLASSPFTALWAQGAAGTADEARCAAASLLEGSETAGQALPLLLSCRQTAPEGARRTALDLALTLTYGWLDRSAEQAETARSLAAAFPRSERAYRLLNGALMSLENWDELRRLAEARLAVDAKDRLPALVLYEIAVKKGDPAEAEKQLRQIIDNGKADSTDFNNLAWLALVRGQVNDQAIAHAQRAAALSEYRGAGALHTLAALYAEIGKTAEAYQVILQALAAKRAETPDSNDWYVFGRLAEHYGLPDAARRYYARMTPPETGAAAGLLSTYRLARRRLAIVEKMAKMATD
jgi:transglutaminase-like putative cysteine protease/predicted Zn-dependent protease